VASTFFSLTSTAPTPRRKQVLRVRANRANSMKY